MSEQNHPNFHAVGFATDIMVSFYNRLRGRGPEVRMSASDIVAEEVAEFVSRAESIVDSCVSARSLGLSERLSPADGDVSPEGLDVLSHRYEDALGRPDVDRVDLLCLLQDAVTDIRQLRRQLLVAQAAEKQLRQRLSVVQTEG